MGRPLRLPFRNDLAPTALDTAQQECVNQRPLSLDWNQQVGAELTKEGNRHQPLKRGSLSPLGAERFQQRKIAYPASLWKAPGF